LGNVKLIDNLNPMCDGVHTYNSFNNSDLARLGIMFQECKEYRHFYTFVIAELIKISKEEEKITTAQNMGMSNEEHGNRKP